MANEPGYKTREESFSRTAEFQQVQPPDLLSKSQMQATYSKAAEVKTLSAKTQPYVAAAILEQVQFGNRLYGDRLDKGMIQSIKIGRMGVDEFLSNISWDDLKQIRTIRQAGTDQQAQNYSFEVPVQNQRYYVMLSIRTDETTLAIADSKGNSLFQMAQEGSQVMFYSPQTPSGKTKSSSKSVSV